MNSLSCLKSQPSFRPSFPPLVHLFLGFGYSVVHKRYCRTGDVGIPSSALPSAYNIEPASELSSFLPFPLRRRFFTCTVFYFLTTYAGVILLIS